MYPVRLADAIRQLTDDPQIAIQAQRLGTVLSAKDGPSAAADVIASLPAT